MDFIRRLCFKNKEPIKEITKNDEKNNLKKNTDIFLNKKQTNFDTCVICLENMKYNETLMIIQCSHIFHKECLQLWMNKKTICPLCDYQF
tara:strand:+ start:1042 stop:1311 length:270 start_codon:yes stop_codon:yes gene_type:complete